MVSAKGSVKFVASRSTSLRSEAIAESRREQSLQSTWKMSGIRIAKPEGCVPNWEQRMNTYLRLLSLGHFVCNLSVRNSQATILRARVSRRHEGLWYD